MPRALTRAAVPVVAATVLAAGGAWALTRPAGPHTDPAGPAVKLADYTTASSCPQLLAELRDRAHPHVTAYGLDTAGDGPGPWPIAAVAAPEAVPRAAAGSAGAAPDSAPAAPPAAPGLTSATGTNVQVPGVDEADVSKRSGDLLLTVGTSGNGPGLTVLRTGAGGSARVLGRLATDWAPASLLVDGSTALLLGPLPTLIPPDGSRVPRAVPGSPRPYRPGPLRRPRTRLAQVDLTDPAHPRLVRTLDVDGDLVGARLAGGVVRLSVSAAPDRLPFVQPTVRGVVPPDYGVELAGGNGPGRGTDLVPGVAATPTPDDAAARALAENRRVVDTSTIDQWLPQWTLTPAGGPARSGRLLDCTSVGMPTAFSGLGVLALLTLDLRGGGIDRWDGAGVVASGATLYSTADRSYVTTTQWPENGVGRRTLVHAFGTGADGVHYLGSGGVDGTLIGSSALDEYEGKLRVATTTDPLGGPRPAAGVAGISASSSAVTVLELRGGRLQQVGRVEGLGTTEVVRAVRFAGPVGYVVTFRRTDPLYTLDLADPAHPRVAGELRLLGYSAYLHPLGGGLLLGVGMDATADGMRTGLQMSLFDVADPARPRLLDRVALPGTWAAAEGDAHAFTYAGGVALVPALAPPAAVAVEGSADGAVSSPPPPDPGGAVVAVRVQGRTLAAPRLLHLATGGVQGFDLSGLRTFVGDGSLWSVAPGSPAGVVAVHDASSLRWLGSTRF